MKLRISFNLSDLDTTLKIASEVKEHCDEFEIGSPLIARYGTKSVEKFRKKFPEKILVSKTNIIGHEKEIVRFFSEAGSDWITVLAGAAPNIIHSACNAAHSVGKKVLLDMVDSSSMGQTALEAKTLGADALLFRKTIDETDEHIFLDLWDMVQGNATLPIYITTRVTRENIENVIKTNPAGIIVGRAITQAEDPKAEAAHFYGLIKSKN